MTPWTNWNEKTIKILGTLYNFFILLNKIIINTEL